MAWRMASRMSGTGVIGALASITLVRSGSRTVSVRSPYAMRSARIASTIEVREGQVFPTCKRCAKGFEKVA